VHRTTFRIDGEDDLAAATRDRDLRVSLWCGDHADLLYVRGDDPGAVLEHVRATAGVADALRDGHELVAVTGDCLADHGPAVDPILAAHGCLLLEPIVYADGARRIRVLALSAAALSAAYRDLRASFPVTVESKLELETVGDPRRLDAATDGRGPAPDLSPRQREVLAIAVREGYFERPRGTTTEAIADEVGVDRRTAEEHLRKAERKVIDAFADRQLP
jgi:predicted DNA binding protein